MRRLFALLLLLAVGRVEAQTVLACTADWGASASCGGCSGFVWADPATDPKVYSPDRPYWDRLSVLTSTQRVAVSTNPPGAATCQTTNLVTKAALTGSTPPTPPTPTTPPTSANGTATIGWDFPTTRTDGTPVTLTGSNVYAGVSPTAVAKANATLIPYPTNSYEVSGLTNGTWYFRVTVVDDRGIESAQTNPASVVVNVPTTPPPPAAVWKVATNGTNATRPAYELILDAAGVNRIRGYQLGTVAIGKPCGDAKRIAGTTEYHDVAEADVTLQSPTYRGRALVAVCKQ